MTESATLVGVTVSHYRIMNKIGEGGMGVVYRARDEQLDRDVALKVLPAGTLPNEKARKQFRNEALALAKLNHPNIETVHEFSSCNGIDFLVMELVPGRTLKEKLKTGALAQADIIRLAMQLSEGLSAAHEQGIIHRDLKPGNVMVTPDSRLKILDFGLATLVQPEPSHDLTQSGPLDFGRVSGTLPYMSPEQLRGMQLDPRSDIFAAGAVLYEMATGRRPFPHLHSTELMEAILHKTPDAPHALNPQILPALERVICKALEKEPSNRYHTAREMHAALEGISASHRSAIDLTTLSLPGGEKPISILARRRFRWIGATTGLLAIFAASTYFLFNEVKLRPWPSRKEPSETGLASSLAIRSRPSIAVLGFKNVSERPEKAWVSTALSEMLTTELAAGEQLRTVSGEDVAHMKVSLSLPETDGYGHESLQKIHSNLNVDVIVLGSYVTIGDNQVRLDLRLQDTSRGVTLASISEKGSENHIDDLVAIAAAQLREKLGVGAVSPAQSSEAKTTLPSTPNAIRLYAEGIARLRAFDNAAARDLLQRAVLEEPNLALAHSALASAYLALGYDEKARQSARNAFNLSSQLSREDRLLVDARYREVNKEWDNAIESYRILFGFFPDNLEYGLFFAESQIRGGRAKEALGTIESLRRFPEDPRIDLKAAEAYVSVGDFGKAHSSATSAAEKARLINARLILADSLLQSGQASESLNLPAQAARETGEAEAIYDATGNRNGKAKSLEVMANILADMSDFSGAMETYKKQLAIARSIGNRRLEASALNNMAIVLNGQGDPVEAKKLWEQSLLGFRDVNDRTDMAEVLINLGGLLLDEGNLTGAKKFYQQALSISQDVNDQSGVSTATTALGTVLDAQGDLIGAKKLLEHALEIDLAAGMGKPAADKLICLGDVLRHQGDLARATKTYQDALTQTRAAGDKSNTAYALMGLGEIALDSADFANARNDYAEAFTIRSELGEKKNVAATQVAMAQLAIDDGRPGDAPAPLKSAIERFRELRTRDDELGATLLLIQTLLAEHKASDANRELSAVTKFAWNSQSPALKVRFEMTVAAVEAASGRRDSAVSHLRKALATAVKLGFVKYELECRVNMELVNTKFDSPADTGSRLNALAKDATDKGFILIARRASENTVRREIH